MRRQLKVAFITMMKEAERLGDGDELDLKEGGQQGWDHHSHCSDFILTVMPKVGRSVKREERWRESLNDSHVTCVGPALGSCSLSSGWPIKHKEPFK